MSFEKDVKLVVCSSDHESGEVSYLLFDHKFKCFMITLDLFEYHPILKACKGDVYVLGYLYNGKFFDQFFYLGKGKLS